MRYEVWDPRVGDDYTRGLLDGVARFAWWKDGVQYVGSTGMTLRQAQEEILRERDYQLPEGYPERMDVLT